jgi:hypothetical protein
MANEFHYSVSLSILHPTVDPKHITSLLVGLRPRIETMAGTERRTKDGKLIVPPRKAPLSHWLAGLHDEKRLYSGSEPISNFILERLTELEKHRDLFAELGKEGRVELIIGWFSESNYSAAVLDCETLKKSGELGIDIELNFYSPSSQS